MPAFPSRRSCLTAGAAAVAASALPARAQAPVNAVFGYTAVTDFATVFIAREEGYFQRHGIDVEPRLIPLNPAGAERRLLRWPSP